MVDSNKILTVSYGTFSCTLEGFDDAFETMKAIAEYFRDLAADDRFFGAEPPTPDAEMLARIAERGSARRVEARASDEGIVLRSGETRPAPALAPASPAAAPAPAPETAERPAPAAMPDTPAPAAPAPRAEAPTESFEDEPDEAFAAMARAAAATAEEEDSIVAKLRRIRSVVSRTAPGAYAEDEEAYVPSATPEAEAPDLGTVQPQAEAEADTGFEAELAPEEAEAIPAEPQHAEADAAAFEDDAEDDLWDDDLAEAEETEETEETLFDETEEDDDDVLGYDEDDAAYAEDEDEAEAAYDDEAYADEASDDEPYGEEAADDGAYDDVSEDDEAYDDVAEDAAPAVADRPEETAPAAAAARATSGDAVTSWPRVVKVKRRDFEAARQPAAEAPAPASQLTPEQEAELQSELAELEAEIEATTAGGQAEDTLHTAPAEPYEEVAEDDAAYDEAYEDDDFVTAETYEEDEFAEAEAEDASHDDAVEAARPLHAEPEDDVAAEDHAAHAEDEFDADEEDDEEAWERALTDDAPEAEAAEAEAEDAPVAPAHAAAPAGRARFDASAPAGDMDRILAETNNQLHETEGTRRRSAIQHLRAAVAATKAEQEAGSDLGAAKREDHTNPYREDLAQVVRPRRPRASGTPSRRMEDKPAPLRLVAEQRVDIAAEHREPVRPRRVSIADLIRQEAEEEDMETAAAPAPAAKGEGFPAFLEASGATDLAEVLEAAASYLAFVEGREQFSRPQLMSRVREVDPDGYSREDALRAFGSLLREGKIRKVKGGRFSASDRIGFRPDQRAVG